MSGLTGATAISTGNNHTCAVLDDDTTHCWGNNTYGQLGDGEGFSTTPVTVVGIP